MNKMYNFNNDILFHLEKGLKQYATGSHDLNKLSIPGRVFFLKSRKFKKVYYIYNRNLYTMSMIK